MKPSSYSALLMALDDYEATVRFKCIYLVCLLTYLFRFSFPAAREEPFLTSKHRQRGALLCQAN